MNFWSFYSYVVNGPSFTEKELEAKIFMKAMPIITIPYLYYHWVTRFKKEMNDAEC